MIEKQIMKLEQRPRFKGRHSFEIKSDGTVAADYTGSGLRQQITLFLSGINPNPTLQKYKATDMIVAMCIFAIPVLGFLWLSITARPGTDAFPWFFGMFLVFLLPFGLCWREFIHKSYDIIIFTEPATGNRLVLYNNLPDPDTFTAFVFTLKEAISKAQGNSKDKNIGFKT